MTLVGLDEAPGAEVVGAKAAALGQLRHAGLPVPAGVCVSVAVELDHLRRLGLESLVRELAMALSAGQGWRRPAALLRARLAEAELAPNLITALGAGQAALFSGPLRAAQPASLAPPLRPLMASLVAPGGALAVRSSALVEGRPRASFAGLFASFLGVRRLDDLITAVKATWSSRWADHVLLYATSRGLAIDQLAMGVLIQVAVPAVAAGGAESVDDDSLIVNGVWGLGRALAEAEIVPDLWRLDRASVAVREHRPGSQTLLATLSASGGDVWQPVPPAQAGRACLDEATLLGLGALLRDVEAILGGPQSIEWALDADGVLWLVQARPLSTLGTAHGQTDVASRRVSGLHGGRVLVGEPAAAGQAIGRAHLLRSIDELPRLGPDAVVVASHLRPGATVLLPRVAGLVLEAGGTTSHAASLARERAIPAVFGARGATRLIPPGARVTVDGSAGRVWYQL